VLRSEQVELEVRRFYRIQNGDSTILTVGGESMENVKIVTLDPTGYVRDPKLQSFWIGSRVGIDSGIYEISPAAQNAVISLVLEENTDKQLLFQQVRHFRNTQWWRILNIEGGNYWQIINDRTNLCLVSRGNGIQVATQACDISVKNQTWIFDIERKGDSFP